MALDPITAVFDGVTTIVNKIWPDATEAQKQALQIELATLQANTDLLKGQLAINQVEAGSSSLFVAGWRPFIGWVCGATFVLHFMLFPATTYIAAFAGKTVAVPTFDMLTLMNVLGAMLGIGGLRTYEKVKGVSK